MVAGIVKDGLERAGFTIEELVTLIEKGQLRPPLQICKSLDGSIAVIQMPDGCRFEGVSCWLQSVPFLVSREVAEDWGMLQRLE